MNLGNYPPTLDFEPLYYIVDHGRNRTMAVKKYDKYEMSGVYIEYNGNSNSWHIYAANLNNQAIIEYKERFELTKEERYALFYPAAMWGTRILTEEQCNSRYSNSEFHY